MNESSGRSKVVFIGPDLIAVFAPLALELPGV